MKHLADRPKLTDCAFLFGVVLLSALPYLSGLGFHGDDWWYQAEFAKSADQSLGKVFLHEWTGDSDALVRPVMVAYVVLSYRAFGQHAMPYHLVNTAVLGLTIALLYLALNELQLGRWLAFVIALLFGLLPHYSTDRFWFASHQATFCMALALLGIYALLRSARQNEPHPKMWSALAVISMVLSILSYEVAAGLIVATIGILGWRRVADSRVLRKQRFARLGGIAATAAVLLVVGIMKIRAQNRIAYHHHLLRFLPRLGRLSLHAMTQAIQFNFWTYGLKMPRVLLSLYRHSALSVAALAIATIIAFCVAAYLWRHMEPSAFPSRHTCIWLIAFGFFVFGLGYGVFILGLGFDFSSAGINNRVTIASAVGASCVLVAMTGLVCSLLKSDLTRARAFSLAIGFSCGINSLIVCGIGFFWVDAASQQAAILESVAANVRSLPHGSVLLLDGFCRFSGPGVVFESDWDVTGAIQLALGDFSLTSDVVSPNMSFNNVSADSTIYGGPDGHYPYGNQLFVYNVRYRILTALPSRESATDYLRAMNPTGDSGCPAGHEGDGEKVF
jgi:hypothetical protein